MRENIYRVGNLPGLGWVKYLGLSPSVGSLKAFLFATTISLNFPSLPPPGSSPTLAVLTPAEGYETLLMWQDDPTRGLFVRGRNTIALGFMPQLMDGPEGEVLRELFFEQLDLQLRLKKPL